MGRNSAAIWQGFDVSWKGTPHRLAEIGSWLEGDAAKPEVAGCARSRFAVGRWPDQGSAKTFMAGVRSEQLQFIDGEVTARLSGMCGQDTVQAGSPITLPIPQGYQATAILRGFSLRCLNHPGGVHGRGFGIQLTQIRCNPTSLSFVPQFRLSADRSPDFFTRWSGIYRFEVVAYYTVVIAPPGTAHLGLGADSKPCHRIRHSNAAPQTRSARREGLASKFNRGLLAIRGFDWKLNPVRRTGTGRFLRRLHTFVEQPEYRPGSRTLDFNPSQWFSNRGTVPYKLDAEHQLWTTLLQYNDDRPVLHEVLDHHIPTGLGDGAKAESQFHLR